MSPKRIAKPHFTKNSSANVAQWVMTHLEGEDSQFSEKEQEYLRSIKNNLQGWDEGTKIKSWSQRFEKATDAITALYEHSSNAYHSQQAVDQLLEGMFDYSTYYQKKINTNATFKNALEEFENIEPETIVQPPLPIDTHIPSDSPIEINPKKTQPLEKIISEDEETTKQRTEIVNTQREIIIPDVPEYKRTHGTAVMKRNPTYPQSVPKPKEPLLTFGLSSKINEKEKKEQNEPLLKNGWTTRLKEKILNTTRKTTKKLTYAMSTAVLLYPFTPLNEQTHIEKLFSFQQKQSAHVQTVTQPTYQKPPTVIQAQPVTVSPTQTPKPTAQSIETIVTEQPKVVQEVENKQTETIETADEKSERIMAEMIANMKRRSKDKDAFKPTVTYREPTLEQKVSHIKDLVRNDITAYMNNAAKGGESTVFSDKLVQTLIKDQYGFTQETQLPIRTSNLFQLYTHVNQKMRTQRFKQFSSADINEEKVQLYKTQVTNMVTRFSEDISSDPDKQSYITRSLLPRGEQSLTELSLALSFSGKEPTETTSLSEIYSPSTIQLLTQYK